MAAGFVDVNGDSYQHRFEQLMAQRGFPVTPMQLKNGYQVVPIFQITPAQQTFTQEERARCNLLDFEWQPKGQHLKFPQRCPAVAADNFVFFYTKDMAEPCLLFGRWTKDVQVYGNKTRVDGLVLAAGGHVERMAKKRDYFNETFGRLNATAIEEGHMTVRESADQELKEEVGFFWHGT
jgi:hypothetical protein